MGNVKKNKWFIAISKRTNSLFDTSGMKVIEPAPDTYHADPFLFRNLIFFELYNYEKGVIACMEKDGSNIRVVLESPFHLSFPFIFEDEGNVYMVPESGSGGKIELYRCISFPDRWEPVKTLTEGVFGDTVIFKEHGAYWLFTTEGDNDLRIYRAGSLFGNWDKVYSESHLNSRSAGNIFKFEKKLVRPTQGGNGYGEKIFFKEFALPYWEKTMFSIEPKWMPGLTGTHTFNFDDTHVVIDGRVKLMEE